MSFRNTNVYYCLFYLYNSFPTNIKDSPIINTGLVLDLLGIFLFWGLDCLGQLLIMLVMLLTPKSTWLNFLSCAIYVKGKMQGIDGATPIQNRSVAPCMSLKITYLLQSSALVCTHNFPQHQAAFLGHRWRNSYSFAKIRMGLPT